MRETSNELSIMSLFLSSRGVASFFPKLGAAPRVRLKRLFLGAFGLGLGVWMWHWLGTDEKGDPIVDSDEPALEIENLKPFLVRRDGLPLWEISARRVVLSADNTSTLATGVNRGIFFREGKPFLNLSAPRVRLANASNNLEASGGVSATGPNGFSFQTSRAIWRNQEQIVDCPKAVTAWLKGLWFGTPRLSYHWQKGVLMCPETVEVRGQGIVLRGQNLEATLGTRQVKQSGGVEIVLDPRAAKIELPR